MKKLKRLICLAVIILIFLVTANAAAFEITIASEVEVNSAEIYLAEIAAINAGELSAAQLNELKTLKLKNSPKPGYRKRLTRVLVDLSIKNLGYKSSEFKLNMPQVVEIGRKEFKISQNEILALVKSHFESNLDSKIKKIEIESRNNRNEPKISFSNYELKLAPEQNLSLSKRNFKFEVWQNDKKVDQFFYPLQINILIDAVVANKNIKRDTTLNQSDFIIKEKNVSTNYEDLITDFSEIDFENNKLSHNLNKGELLKKNYLKKPYVIKWGQKLHLEAEVNNIMISTFVEAKERGKIGDIITVENLNSGYQFQVKVIRPTEVKLISDQMR